MIELSAVYLYSDMFEEYNKYNLEVALNLDNLFLDAPEKYAVTRLFL